MTPGPGGPLYPRAGETIGALLSRLRLSQGKSQLRVAELLCAASGVPTVTRHEVSRWEREERIPSAQWLRWLAVVLDAPLAELERATALTRARRFTTAPSGHTGKPVGPLGEPVVPTGKPVVPESQGPRATSPREGIAAHRDDADPIAGLAVAGAVFDIADLRRMDDLIGGSDLTEIVERELRRATAALGELTPGPAPGLDALTIRAVSGSRAGRTHLRSLAELAQLAGWVAADAGASESALHAHRAALRAAGAAGDGPLAGHLLGCVAQLAAEAGSSRAALRLARAAVRRAGATSSGSTRALLWQRVAYAATVAGERRTAEEALVVAERAYERRDPARDPDWIRWYDEVNFTAMAGRCYAALGRSRLARPLLVAALAGRDRGRRQLGPRAWALCATALAGAHVDAGDLDAACTSAGEALLMCVRSGSVRATRQLRAAEPRLRAVPGHPALRSYEELAASAAGYLPDATPTSPPRPAFASGDD